MRGHQELALGAGPVPRDRAGRRFWLLPWLHCLFHQCVQVPAAVSARVARASAVTPAPTVSGLWEQPWALGAALGSARPRARTVRTVVSARFLPALLLLPLALASSLAAAAASSSSSRCCKATDKLSNGQAPEREVRASVPSPLMAARSTSATGNERPVLPKAADGRAGRALQQQQQQQHIKGAAGTAPCR